MSTTRTGALADHELKATADLILAHGPDWDIFTASALGNREEVATLLRATPALAHARTSDGRTPLHLAAQLGQKEVVELLLSSGAHVNARDQQGRTPLHYMVMWCTREDVVELLLAHGAELNARDNYDSTPLSRAAACIHRPGYEWGFHEWLAPFLLNRGAELDIVAATILNASEELAALLRADPSLANVRDRGAHVLPEGATPLHHAADRGHKQAAQVLLERGGNVNAKDGRGRPPLYLAAHDAGTRKMGPSSEVVELLLAHGAELDIFASALLGRIDHARQLLEADPSLINARDDGGYTPLHLAAWNGQEEVVELLLLTGADINAGNKRGETPVALAAIYGDRDVVQYLIKSGAMCDIFTGVRLGRLDQITARLQEDPTLANARNRYGRTLLRLAAQRAQFAEEFAGEAGLWDVVVFLLRNGAELDIWAAASFGKRDQIANLLEATPALVNAYENGYTPLHCATQKGHLDVVELMLDRGAALEARDPAGHTPLFWATGILPGVRRGQEEMVELLVSRGADFEAMDNWGNTPFDAALATPDVAEVLLAHGAELTIWAAAALGKREQVEGMVQADPSLVNAEGGFLFTPLHWAALNGQKAVAALLLELGADVNVRGAFGQTPLQRVLGAGHTEVADLLRQHGAID